MPLYKFHCRICNDDFEMFLTVREMLKGGGTCPICGSGDVDGPLQNQDKSPQACEIPKRNRVKS